MTGLASYIRLATHRHWRQLRMPVGLLLLSSCISVQSGVKSTTPKVATAATEERTRTDQATELTIAKQQVRLLLLRTQLEAQAAELAAANEQLQAERKLRTNLEAAAEKPAAEKPVARAAPTASVSPEQKAARELLRRQAAVLESAVRTSRDSVARQSQQLQQAKASARNLEQTVAERDRTIGDLRQRLSAALRKQSANAPLNDGRMHVILPDEPVKALIRAVF